MRGVQYVIVQVCLLGVGVVVEGPTFPVDSAGATPWLSDSLYTGVVIVYDMQLDMVTVCAVQMIEVRLFGRVEENMRLFLGNLVEEPVIQMIYLESSVSMIEQLSIVPLVQVLCDPYFPVFGPGHNV